ncbi:retrovirus-related pol polyprotein from transposon TNT 1-94 [Tanacetum coccineum]
MYETCALRKQSTVRLTVGLSPTIILRRESSTSKLESKGQTKIKESKDLTSLSLDELIENLKVHEMIIKKDSEIVKVKVERKYLALNAKKEYSSWSDSGEEDDEKVNNKTCLVAQASSEICLGVDLEPDEWIKNSGCSKHMTGNRKLFSSYKAYNGDMCDEFAKIMHDEFEMSMMGELNFFLGLQIKQMEDGIFFNQSKYIKEMLKKFGLEDSKPMKTPMSSDTKLTKDEELSAFVPASKRLPKLLTLKRLSVSSDTLKALRT